MEHFKTSNEWWSRLNRHWVAIKRLARLYGFDSRDGNPFLIHSDLYDRLNQKLSMVEEMQKLKNCKDITLLEYLVDLHAISSENYAREKFTTWETLTDLLTQKDILEGESDACLY